MENILIAGIMTGTSLDGIDVAICSFTDDNGKTKFELLAAKTFRYDSFTVELIGEVINQDITISAISNLSSLLAEEFSRALSELCYISRIKLNSIDAIAVHGQTVWHQPIPVNMGSFNIKSTLQLVDAQLLAHRCGCRVIYDFRSADMAMGGQGAPLVPIFDKEFLASGNNDVICLNIGGIANITYLPSGENKKIIAFDVGPGNILINAAMKYYFNRDYDDRGSVASSGKRSEELFCDLISHHFIYKIPPKSTGYETFGQAFFKRIIEKPNLAEDIVNTLTHFTAECIRFNIDTFCCGSGKIIVSGGGAKNDFLLELLRQNLSGFSIETSDAYGISADFKEAMAFAYLGYLNLKRLPGNLPMVTGAYHRTVLGSRYDYVIFPD